jgi:hypothetical protein
MPKNELSKYQRSILIDSGIPSNKLPVCSNDIMKLINNTLQHLIKINPDMEFFYDQERKNIGAEQWIKNKQFHPMVIFTVSLSAQSKIFNIGNKTIIFSETDPDIMNAFINVICCMAKSGMMNYLK